METDSTQSQRLRGFNTIMPAALALAPALLRGALKVGTSRPAHTPTYPDPSIPHNLKRSEECMSLLKVKVTAPQSTIPGLGAMTRGAVEVRRIRESTGFLELWGGVRNQFCLELYPARWPVASAQPKACLWLSCHSFTVR